MRAPALFFSLICLLFGICDAQVRSASRHVEKYKSPDKTIVATIISTERPEATSESRIEFRTTAGEILGHADYSSGDGEHGYGVVKAAWTPDSQFFIYSLTSSGGHQAWHSPVKFFSRKEKKVFSLDNALRDSVSNPQFDVTAPDIVTVELYFSEKKYVGSLSKLRAGN